MKNLFIICFLCFQYSAFSQIPAITDSGDNVVLNKDGTWLYLNDLNKSSEGSGNWTVKYYVDDFGDPTNEGYIANQDNLVGQFSNSATTNSELKACFIVSDSSSVAIKLFEYGSSTVKAYSIDTYTIKVKDSIGNVHSLNGTIYKGGDRLYIDNSYKKKHVSQMHNLLLKGGKLTFLINSTENSLTNYKIPFDATGYKNAYNQLHK